MSYTFTYEELWHREGPIYNRERTWDELSETEKHIFIDDVDRAREENQRG